ncbi:hypothetical protein SAMN04489712_104523 [Thermomonospora echinospora]|uniref:DUF4190 domain-containing protein n=1 Tax=Thermomonospora echinospora TaxID=1992 RepID=A0A1H5ZEL5_9ACTN|nr:hypothetical protein [Thermomonospora echinospora]SEG34919.1 hypothetical protein SAMN04489712_104523 [Thermomonospora echinospora]
MSIEPGQDTRPGPEGPGTPPGPGAPQDVERAGRRALWLGLAALVMIFVPVLSIFAAIPAVAAIVIGVKARRAARQGRRPAPGALPGIILGGVGALFFAFGIGAQLYLLEETNRYSKCQNAANTIEEGRQCKERLADDIEKKFGLPEGTIDGDSLPL